MRKWQQKAIVQKAISFLPFSHGINYLFQQYVTRGVRLSDEYFADRLGHAGEHIGAFGRHSPDELIASSLELGTGWYPVVPVSLFLHGAREIHTVDLAPLCNRVRLVATLRRFADHRDRLPFPVLTERWRDLSDLLTEIDRLAMPEILARLRIHYRVGDARNLPLPDGSVSLVTSNNTLEHVDAAALRGILREFRRLAAPGGVMSHFIDMSDHFAHFDPSITVYNYLQYSRRQWALIDNAIQPQNRLRIGDYRALYAELGIPVSEEIRREGNLEELAHVRVHPDFQHVPAAEIAVSHCLLVSRMRCPENPARTADRREGQTGVVVPLQGVSGKRGTTVFPGRRSDRSSGEFLHATPWHGSCVPLPAVITTTTGSRSC